MQDVESLVKSLLEDLPEEARRNVAEWIAQARAATPAEVERELLLASRQARDEFTDAAALVERMITE